MIFWDDSIMIMFMCCFVCHCGFQNIKITNIIQVGIRPDRRAGGMLDISAGSEAAVWDNWSEEIHFKINDKMMENQWKSTWVGASWAMLAQNDTFLKRSWRKMTERIDFSLIFRTILGYQNHTKINEKMKWFSDALKNCVFCARRSQRLQNGGPKGIENQAFSGI